MDNRAGAGSLVAMTKLNHTVTPADVKRIYEACLATVVPGGPRTSPAEARQGTRTEVHELLQAQVPCPYQMPPPGRVFGPGEAEARNLDIARRKTALALSIPDELVIESERARGGPDGTHRDAVHYVQKKHGAALWAEADRLVAETLGGAS